MADYGLTTDKEEVLTVTKELLLRKGNLADENGNELVDENGNNILGYGLVVNED